MEPELQETRSKTFDLAFPQVVPILRDLLNNDISVRIRVTGQSMGPFLKGGEIVLIRQTSPNLLHQGDIILYTDQDEYPILHRIIRKRSISGDRIHFQTKGDANIIPDQFIGPLQILGRIEQIFVTCEKHEIVARLIDLNSRLRKIQARIIAWYGILRYYLYRIRAQ